MLGVPGRGPGPSGSQMPPIVSASLCPPVCPLHVPVPPHVFPVSPHCVHVPLPVPPSSPSVSMSPSLCPPRPPPCVPPCVPLPVSPVPPQCPCPPPCIPPCVPLPVSLRVPCSPRVSPSMSPHVPCPPHCAPPCPPHPPCQWTVRASLCTTARGVGPLPSLTSLLPAVCLQMPAPVWGRSIGSSPLGCGLSPTLAPPAAAETMLVGPSVPS